MNRFCALRGRGMISIALVIFFVFGTTVPAQESPVRTQTLWNYITYPGLTFSKSGHDGFVVSVGYGQQDELHTFRVDMIWASDPSKITPDDIKKVTQTRVRLHYPDGTVVEPVQKPDGLGGGAGSGKYIQYDQMYCFPYGPNKLVEAWVELRVSDHTCWLEVPYGFVRDPRTPLPAAEPDAGLPVLAPAMKHLAPDDLIVPWLKVDYDLGKIQHGWRLGLEQSNPFRANCKVTLYRESHEPWELHTPKTSVTVAEDGGETLPAQQSAARITDSYRRVDDFDFGTDPGDEKRRNWGTLTIRVEGKPTSAVIPSSLFKYTHGIAEPYNPQRMRIKPMD